MPVETAIAQIQELMWKQVGIVRTADGMKHAIQGLKGMEAKLAHPRTRREYEARNLQIAGSLVARSALAREESRGAHYRTDFSDPNDVKFKKHSIVSADKVRFE